jgi:hypothetical protein
MSAGPSAREPTDPSERSDTVEVLAEEEEEEGLSSNILTASFMIKDANGTVVHEEQPQAQAPAEEGGKADWRRASVSSTSSGRSSEDSSVARSYISSAAVHTTSATSDARQGLPLLHFTPQPQPFC